MGLFAFAADLSGGQEQCAEHVMSLRNYLRFRPYSRRLGMLPGLLRSLWADFRVGPNPKKPTQRLYAKYEGVFREIFE